MTSTDSDAAAMARKARNPRQVRGQIRIDAILDACARLLTQSESSVTMHRLARESETSIGSLYHFFPDKQSVLEAFRDRHLAALRELTASLNLISDKAWQGFTPAQLVDQLLRPYLDYFVHNPEFLHLIARDNRAEHTLLSVNQLLRTQLQLLFVRVFSMRLPMASELEIRAFATTLFSLPMGMLTHLNLEYDEPLREPVLSVEIPLALVAYVETREAAYMKHYELSHE